jgi:hypothetical protein
MIDIDPNKIYGVQLPIINGGYYDKYLKYKNKYLNLKKIL